MINVTIATLPLLLEQEVTVGHLCAVSLAVAATKLFQILRFAFYPQQSASKIIMLTNQHGIYRAFCSLVST